MLMKRVLTPAICLTVGFCVSMMTVAPARAAFHLWNLQELYSDSTGTLQFIELFTTSNTQTNFTSTRSITVRDAANLNPRTFNTPTSTLPGTANRTLLYGTAGLQAAGGPTPDYIIPDNFLHIGGGNIAFFGANGGAYTALPTNGTQSRAWTSGIDSVNSPRNFAGTTGTVSVPEPSSVILVPLAVGSMYWISRRRRTKLISGSA
jgi:hypothetical protein